MVTRIIIASDHAGIELKDKVMKHLKKRGIDVQDIGSFGGNPHDDYPDFAFEVGEKVVKSPNLRGILICGTGTGMVIAANKVKGVRAALVYDSYSAKMAMHDNNINVLCLRGREFDSKTANKLIEIWLKTPYSKLKRHKRRLQKIKDYENKN